MLVPPRTPSLRAVVCTSTLIAAASLASCDDPGTTPPETAPDPDAPQAAAAHGGQTGVCDRTWQVRDEIMEEVGKDDCAEVTDADLAGIGYLSLRWYGFGLGGESLSSHLCEDSGNGEPATRWDGTMTRGWSGTGKPICPMRPSRADLLAGAANDTTRITALKEGDLDGLTNLWSLSFEGQGLSTLPDGIFDDLGNLTDLSFSLNRFRTLDADVFGALESLEDLDLSGNLLITLPEDIFDGLDALADLDLFLNNLHALPGGVFDGLESLETLDLRVNRLTELPADGFAGLGNLSELLLDLNRIGELPDGVFDGLHSLQTLWMDGNRLTELPEGVFDDLGFLSDLTLVRNGLTKLSEDAFEELGRLVRLWLPFNRLTEVPAGAFEGLGALEELVLAFNELDSLPQGVFDGLHDLEELYLSDNRLSRLPPRVFDELGDLGLLDLSGNRLGTLQEGVFDGLDNLRSLGLYDNLLATLPGGVFDDLDDLTVLSLFGNRLGALPEGMFDGLDNLVSLLLQDNRLATLPAGVFDDLGDLEILVLADNRLGSLPEGIFDRVDDLLGVNLRGNNLAELPPGLFAGLDDLEAVWLHENPGAPFPFHLELARTDNTNQLAPPPATVEVRVAEGAPFEVSIALSSRGGTLDDDEIDISVGDTESKSVTASAEASAPHSVVMDSIWNELSWFDEDDYQGFEFIIGAPLVLANPAEVTVDVPAVYLTQGAQSVDGAVPLVAGRQALLRVFATADADNDFDPEARATFHFGGQSVHVYLAPPAVMQRAVDESRLDASFTGVVPAAAMVPGVEMVVELDRTGVIPAAEGSRLRVPATGRMALEVVELDTFDVTLVPVAFGSAAPGRNAAVASLARDMAADDSRGALRPTRSLLPVAEMSVTAREPYVTWADTLPDGILALLDEVNLLRHVEAGGTGTHYHGIFAEPAARYPELWDGILGIAYIAGWSGLSLSHRVNGQYFSGFPATVAHELGHNLGLYHAPCGFPAGVDPRYPYYDGSIGIWGHDFGGGGQFGRLLSPDGHADIMSYCEPAGISDFSFTSALDYRSAISASSSARPAAARETLLLWGSIRDGGLRLEPVFEWTAPVKLPESPGPYRLAGTDGTGRVLFDLRFTPEETGNGDRGFLFAVEIGEDWAANLTTVTLSGPEGSFVARGEDGWGRGAIVTDRATGRIMTIARDWDGVLEREGGFPRVLGSGDRVIVHRSLRLAGPAGR